MASNENRATEALHGESIRLEAVDALLHCKNQREFLDEFAAIAATCGFKNFSYILLGNTLGQPTVLRHWTTAGAHWAKRYQARRYHLVDPRVTLTRDRTVPIVWATESGSQDPKVREFFADAAQCSIRGGVAWSTYDAHVGQVVIAWDADATEDMAVRTISVRGRLGALVMLSGLIHEVVSARLKDDGRRRSSKQLTKREAECVALGARGMTSADIAVKLKITERTANFHFANIIAKLGALNRSEAIAKAVAFRLIDVR